MARFVKLSRGEFQPLWVNPDRVVFFEGAADGKTRITMDDGSDIGEFAYVYIPPEEIAALLTDPPVRLHPSILTDDQPPAWAAKPAKTDGGAS